MRESRSTGKHSQSCDEVFSDLLLSGTAPEKLYESLSTQVGRPGNRQGSGLRGRGGR